MFRVPYFWIRTHTHFANLRNLVQVTLNSAGRQACAQGVKSEVEAAKKAAAQAQAEAALAKEEFKAVRAL